MSYRVDRFNGTFLVSVDDGTIDTSTDLRFIGKNYSGYGEVQNENFLHLLENFANTTAPPKAIQGQLWYDSTSTTKKLKFYDGAQWKSASGAIVSSNSPTNLTAGDFWFDSATNQLYIWNGGSYILVGPENNQDVTSTAIVPADLRDSTGTPYKVLKVNVDTTTVAIISNDTFVATNTTAPSGFSSIKRGFNITSTTSPSLAKFWGTAEDSDKLGGKLPSTYVTQEQLGTFPDSGYVIGSKFRAFIDGSNFPILENLDFSNVNNSITFRIRTDAGNRDSLVIKREGIFPSLDSQFSIGSDSLKWLNVYSDNFIGELFGNSTGTHKGNLLNNSGFLHFDADEGTFFGVFGTETNPGTFYGDFRGEFTGDLNGTAARALSIAGYSVAEQVPSVPIGTERITIPIRDTEGNLYATKFKGTADRADTLLVGSTYRSTALTPDNNTVPVRDEFGDIQANVFRGVATSAQYADLAEKYLSDQSYPIGTVISVGGEKEITSSKEGDRAIGVISGNPAFKMNSKLENGVYVALKGRVPVKVAGVVKKGDRLVASDNGNARSVKNSDDLLNVFAISLTDSKDSEVEAIIL